MERLLAPIVVQGEIYGYMWIIADVQALTRIDMMAIEIGATVAALLMLYQESLHTAEASLKGSLMAQLIEGNGGQRDDPAVINRCAMASICACPGGCCVVNISDGQPPNLHPRLPHDQSGFS